VGSLKHWTRRVGIHYKVDKEGCSSGSLECARGSRYMILSATYDTVVVS
jgi:hypothetical protein